VVGDGVFEGRGEVVLLFLFFLTVVGFVCCCWCFSSFVVVFFVSNRTLLLLFGVDALVCCCMMDLRCFSVLSRFPAFTEQKTNLESFDINQRTLLTFFLFLFCELRQQSNNQTKPAASLPSTSFSHTRSSVPPPLFSFLLTHMDFSVSRSRREGQRN